MIRIVLPPHLRTLAKVGSEVTVEVERPATQNAILNKLESDYPMLRGTIRDHVTLKRRPLPDAVVAGVEPFFVIGAVAGG